MKHWLWYRLGEMIEMHSHDDTVGNRTLPIRAIISGNAMLVEAGFIEEDE